QVSRAAKAYNAKFLLSTHWPSSTTSTPLGTCSVKSESLSPTPFFSPDRWIVVRLLVASRTLTDKISKEGLPTPSRTSLNPPLSFFGSNFKVYCFSSLPFRVILKSFFKLPSPSKKDSGTSDRNAFLSGLLII